MSDKQKRDSEPTFKNLRDPELDANLDPLTREPGSHPFGTAAGTTSAGVAGAVLGGVIAGPVGAAAGALIGGVAGGLAGRAMAESIDPTQEEQYWRWHHDEQPFAEEVRANGYDSYAPAYRVAYGNYGSFEHGTAFEAAEPTLRSFYETSEPTLSWETARPAAAAAWEKIDRDLSGEHRPIDRDLSGEERRAHSQADEPASTNPLSDDAHPSLHL